MENRFGDKLNAWTTKGKLGAAKLGAKTSSSQYFSYRGSLSFFFVGRNLVFVAVVLGVVCRSHTPTC
jgi:hypothetical protein